MNSEVTKIFIGGFPLDMTEMQLAMLIGPYGTIESIKMVRDKKTKVCKGYAFVEVASLKDADNIIYALHGYEVNGRKLTLNIRPENPST